MTDADLTRLQVVRVSANVGYAIIGVARIDRDYEVRAMRLSTDPAQSPPLLFGLPDLPHGARELRGELPWDPPSIAAGATAYVKKPFSPAELVARVDALLTAQSAGT